MPSEGALVVVGIGEDGWDGLGAEARDAVTGCDLLVGSERQLALVPPGSARRVAWPTPLLPFAETVADEARRARVTVLASGDPLLHGIANVFARRLPPDALRVVPHVSSAALACARLCWPVAETEIVSVVARPLARIARLFQPGRRLVVLAENGATAGAVAALLRAHGFGASTLHAFERLGGPHEAHREGSARAWDDRPTDDLTVVAIAVAADDGTVPRPLVPGLPDDAYETDGALTKREVRAVTLAALAPLPGRRLWDVGAGSGSIAVEWLRAEPRTTAIAIERDAARAARIARNAAALGVPELQIVVGAAPASLDGLAAPDAVFIGGGLTVPGLVDRCLAALPPGGRLVANAVTLESEALLVALRARLGGRLVRLEVAHADGLGGFTAWRPQLPVTIWETTR